MTTHLECKPLESRTRTTTTRTRTINSRELPELRTAIQSPILGAQLFCDLHQLGRAEIERAAVSINQMCRAVPTNNGQCSIFCRACEIRFSLWRPSDQILSRLTVW